MILSTSSSNAVLTAGGGTCAGDVDQQWATIHGGAAASTGAVAMAAGDSEGPRRDQPAICLPIPGSNQHGQRKPPQPSCIVTDYKAQAALTHLPHSWHWPQQTGTHLPWPSQCPGPRSPPSHHPCQPCCLRGGGSQHRLCWATTSERWCAASSLLGLKLYPFGNYNAFTSDTHVQGWMPASRQGRCCRTQKLSDVLHPGMKCTGWALQVELKLGGHEDSSAHVQVVCCQQCPAVACPHSPTSMQTGPLLDAYCWSSDSQ
jgi:hypothetical protein